MPNHDTTVLTVRAATRDALPMLLDFVAKYRTFRNDRGKHCLSTAFVPMPAHTSHGGQSGIRPPWLVWALENWGTKWGTYEESDTVTDDRIEIRFDSAWNPPHQLLATIRTAYPNLTFDGVWTSEYDSMVRRFTLDDTGAFIVTEELGERGRYDETLDDYIEMIDPYGNRVTA